MDESIKNQTRTSFSDKWENNKKLFINESLNENSEIYKWIFERNGWENKEKLAKYLSGKKRILDAGCGNGRITMLLTKFAQSSANIVGIDLTSAKVAKENLKLLSNVEIYEKDLLEDLSDLGKFDYIYCQEVLHHTANPLQSFLNLCELLETNGDIAIYVYKRKAPIREYVDDYIRQQISNLSYEESTKVSEQITLLGKSLSELNVKFNAPNIPILGIEEGEYDIQRFIYHFFMKCFYNQDISFEECTAINYDWYHPTICERYTLKEIEEWFNKAGIKITHTYVDHYGITISGKKL